MAWQNLTQNLWGNQKSNENKVTILTQELSLVVCFGHKVLKEKLRMKPEPYSSKKKSRSKHEKGPAQPSVTVTLISLNSAQITW